MQLHYYSRPPTWEACPIIETLLKLKHASIV